MDANELDLGGSPSPLREVKAPDDRKLRRCFMCGNCSVLILMPVNSITRSGYDFHCPVCMEKQWFLPVVPEGSLFRIET